MTSFIVKTTLSCSRESEVCSEGVLRSRRPRMTARKKLWRYWSMLPLMTLMTVQMFRTLPWETARERMISKR